MVSARRILAGDKGFAIITRLRGGKKLSTGEVYPIVKHSLTAARILRTLNRLGYVKRKRTHERHPRVLWSLTVAGEKLCAVLEDTERRDTKNPDVKKI